MKTLSSKLKKQLVNKIISIYNTENSTVICLEEKTLNMSFSFNL